MNTRALPLETSSFLSLLDTHRVFDERLRAHQEALLARDIPAARRHFQVLAGELRRHAEFEERECLPIYARAGKVPGGPPELFTGEHRKIGQFLDRIDAMLAAIERGAEETTRGALAILDEEATLKNLLSHHDSRERNIFYPKLEEVTTPAEREHVLRMAERLELAEEPEPPFRTIIEPFRIKVVEPIRRTTRAERRAAMIEAGYNLFGVPAEKVTIDFLTDSGVAAMSSAQWASSMLGDESYAGATSFFRFREEVRSWTGYDHVLPTHQGRAAERILFECLVKPGQVVLSNTLFDTTRANLEALGGIGIDLPHPRSASPQDEYGFKGDIDCDALERALTEHAGRVALVLLTATSNMIGGHPVALSNARRAHEITKRHGIPLYLDAARIAENAFLVKLREANQHDRSVLEILREFFSLAEGATFSAKKDAFAHIGGFLALRDTGVAAKAGSRLVLTEGFLTYGGLAGRDLEAIAAGLREITDERYLQYRVSSVAYLGRGLSKVGVPVERPFGGHAVYVDAGAWLSHLKPAELPGQSLVCALYEEGGVRACEIGTAMRGAGGSHTRELVRLAMPRRVYTQAHVDYVIETFERLAPRVRRMPAMEIVEEPSYLRHFTAKFRPVPRG
ncbi:MAG: tryptophanase [Planctomycetes bacterium]|nr:tryptophanase [Planctomycetota bacterium]